MKKVITKISYLIGAISTVYLLCFGLCLRSDYVSAQKHPQEYTPEELMPSVEMSTPRHIDHPKKRAIEFI